MKYVYFALVFAMWVIQPVAAKTQLFTSYSNQLDEKSVSSFSHISVHTKHLFSAATLDVDALKRLQKGDALLMNLPDEAVESQVVNIVKGASGSRHIILRSYVGGLPVSSVITLGESAIRLELVTSHGLLSGLGSEAGVVLSNPSEVFHAKGFTQDDFIVASAIQNGKNTALSQGVMSAQQEHSAIDESLQRHASQDDEAIMKAVSTETGEIAYIDVLFVYSNNVTDVIDDIHTTIDHFIAYTNQAFEDSGIFAKVRFKGSVAVDYDYANGSDALDDLSQGNPPFEEIDVHRYQFGADAVALLTPNLTGDSSAGIAFQNGHIKYSGANSMYSQSDVDSSASTFAHELGHNLGLGHSRPQGETGSDFDYGVGYRIPIPDGVGFSTIMSYWIGNTSEVPYFSNPAKLCGELPCGVSKTDANYGADAVAAVNAVRHIVSAYVDENTVRTPFADALSNVSDSNLRQCLESMNHEGYGFAEQLTSLWCYDPVTSLSGLESFTNLDYISINQLQATDLSALASLTKLTNLALYDVIATDFSSLSSLTGLKQLRIGGNNFDNDAATILQDLPQLEELLLDSENLTSLPDTFGSATLSDVTINAPITSLGGLSKAKALLYLKIESDGLGSLPSTLDWPMLETLRLFDISIEDVSFVQGFPNLTSLEIARSTLSSIDAIAQLHGLTSLSLYDNNIDDIGALASLTSLVKLNIAFNPITDFSAIAGLVNLKELDAGTYFAGNIRSWAELKEISTLESLTLYGVSASAIPYISASNSTLTSLSLYDVNAVDLSRFFSAFRLRSLSLYSASDATFYCWQINYLRTLLSGNAYLDFDCSTDDDSNDFDQDGIGNIDELSAGTNPTENDLNPSVIQFDVSSLTFFEVKNTTSYTGVVRRTGNSALTASVDIATSGGTATFYNDYYGPNETLEFSKGENALQFSLNIYDDVKIEGEETFQITLTDAVDAQLGELDTIDVSINDNKDGSDFEVDSGDSGTPSIGWDTLFESAFNQNGAIEIVLNRPVGLEGAFSVEISPLALTDASEDTFTLAQTKIEFAGSDSFRTVTLNYDVLEDEFESRYIVLRLVNPEGVLVNPANGALTVEINNEESVQRQINFEKGYQLAVENDGELQLKLVRNATDSESRTVTIVTNNGTASENDDFSLPESTVTFAPNDTEKLVTFTIHDDDEAEENEYVTLRLDGLPSNLYGDFRMTVIEITDNDSETGVVSFDTAASTVNEADGTFTINVYREGSIAGPLAIDVRTQVGSASGDDFTAIEQVVYFEENQTIAEIQVAIIDDAIEEEDESFSIVIDADDKHLGSITTHTVTIEDNDEVTGVIGFSESEIEVDESAGEVSIALTRTGGDSGVRVVTVYAYENNANLSDFAFTTQEVEFADGETSKSVMVSISEDTLEEGAENFMLEITSASPDVVSAPGRIIITIIDNDTTSDGGDDDGGNDYGGDFSGGNDAVSGGSGGGSTSYGLIMLMLVELVRQRRVKT